MNNVHSKDRTRIAFDRAGTRPALILAGQQHDVAAEVLAPLMVEFFAANVHA